MITTWRILDTRSNISSGLVVKIIYQCMVEFEKDVSSIIGEVELLGDPSLPNFIPFETLTPTILIAWTKATLGAQEVAKIETNLQDSLTARKTARDTATERNGLPWA